MGGVPVGRGRLVTGKFSENETVTALESQGSGPASRGEAEEAKRSPGKGKAHQRPTVLKPAKPDRGPVPARWSDKAEEARIALARAAETPKRSTKRNWVLGKAPSAKG